MSYKYYGLTTILDEKYAIAFSYDEVEKAVKDSIEETICYFNAHFLSCYLPFSSEDIEKLQENLRENSLNKLFINSISEDEFESLVSDAISSDGEGHFLSSYDGEMIETNLSELEIDDEDLFYEISNNFELNIDTTIYLFRLN